ncbi:DEAD/DEAH box helicase [Frigoribacterium sp. PhB24]|uniref:DEAD/DEAH box helicase n=1 Tax=Frigoribacterium sp. PhB24 TaxID=2485204 RepID=UPI000F9F28DB|nr:DEAD/DEAH box helicase family protein [Frigoribacterium sp. PhB24]ROS51515.1 superfamily II DNA or RNA helicase [Frigoribacterium sp. PhB24]
MALWPHQVKAVATLNDYLQRPGARTGAALITMPTGTGKSAVISSLMAGPRVGGKNKSALVLTPWRGLARQLMEDIGTRTWSRVEVTRPEGLPEVRFVSQAKHFVQRVNKGEEAPAIYVATLSMALEIFKTVSFDEAAMKALFRQFATVVVDECHYEPAPGWSRAVRAMGLPICLFSATPFRNDNRMFNIDPSAQFRYSHEAAVAEYVLREPDFEVLEPQSSITTYVDLLLKKIADRKAKESHERVIIRCGNSTDVRAVTDALIARGRKAIGIHETFSHDAKKPHLLTRIPLPADRPDAEYMVHQHKLTEGFDDPSVRVLAVHGGFGNDRARVQQVGRVLRNPSREAGERAVVFSSDGQMGASWNRYLAFDRSIGQRSVAVDPAGIGGLLAAQPDIFYWDRRFREKPNFAADGAWDAIRYRLSTNIRRPDDNFALVDFAAEVTRDLESSGRQILAEYQPSSDVRVLLYTSIRNSPILHDAAFVEMSLGYVVLHWNGSHLFVSSSDGLTDHVRKRTKPLPAGLLVGLLPDASTITAMSLTNSDLSDWAVRSRSLHARDLGQIAAEVGDSTFGYSTASGYLSIEGEAVRRYTGVKHGRVTDYRPSRGLYDELYEWFGELEVALQTASVPAVAISRYGLPTTPENVPVAAHVLLDVGPESFVPEDDGDGPLIVDWRGSAVVDGKFNVTLNKEEIEAEIRWEPREGRFFVGSAANVPYRAVNDRGLDFWQHINRGQLMRVATKEGLVYTNRNFWRLDLHDAASEKGLMSVLTTCADLSNVRGEKGDTKGLSPWPTSTVFGVLERDLLPNSLGPDATILCTDLGSEIADFIGFDAGKVVFAHAKSKSADNPSKVSASALHEVVAQALKSLRFLTLGNTDQPQTDYWGNDWEIKKTKPRTESLGPATRLRRGQAQESGAKHWQAINGVIQAHSSTREVWLVLGACLSKSALMQELKKERPSPASLQVHALLSGAWSSTQQCGVRLRVFCSE